MNMKKQYTYYLFTILAIECVYIDTRSNIGPEVDIEIYKLVFKEKKWWHFKNNMYEKVLVALGSYDHFGDGTIDYDALIHILVTAIESPHVKHRYLKYAEWYLQELKGK
jgi:hypothetical protein